MLTAMNTSNFLLLCSNWVLFQLLSLVSTMGKFAPKGTVMGCMRKICFWSFTVLRFLAHSFQTPWNWDWERYHFKTILFTFNFGCSGHFAACWLSLFVASETYSLVIVCELLIAVSSLPGEHEHQSAWASIVVTCGLSCPVASSWTKDGTPIPCISRWILDPWTNREVWERCIFFVLMRWLLGSI